MHKTFIYTKLISLVLLALYIISFIVINSQKIVDIWLCPTVTKNLSVIWIIAVTALATFLTTWYSRQLISAYRQLRQLKTDKIPDKTTGKNSNNDSKTDSDSTS